MEQNAELILIVEDEPKLAQLLTDYLHAAHYRIALAGTRRRSYGLGAGK